MDQENATVLVRLLFAACLSALVLAQDKKHPEKQDERDTRPILLVGAVTKTTVDSRPRKRPVTVLEVITMAGVTKAADMRRVELLRGAAESFSFLRIDVRQMIMTGKTKYNVIVAPGDILFVPNRQPREQEKKIEKKPSTIFGGLQAALRSHPDSGTELMIRLYFLRRHPDDNVRRSHALAIGALGKAAAQAVPQLVTVLQRSKGRVAEDVITALGMIGPTAKKALPALKRLASHKEAGVRARVRAALRSITSAK